MRSTAQPVYLLLLLIVSLQVSVASPESEPVTHSGPHSGPHQWASLMYEKNTACTVATIDQVEIATKLVKVQLAVEKNTAKGLLGSQKIVRDNWFALHCPSEVHSVWRDEAEFDVLVSAVLAPGDIYTLSCADFYQHYQVRQKETKANVFEKIKSLLAQKKNKSD